MEAEVVNTELSAIITQQNIIVLSLRYVLVLYHIEIHKYLSLKTLALCIFNKIALEEMLTIVSI